MKACIDPSRVANAVQMIRSQRQCSFLLVEGKSDAPVYAAFIDSSCQLIVAHSKDNVIQVIQILEKSKVAGVVGIVDADFWHLDGVKPPSTNIVATDTHDVETMILQSQALAKILNEHPYRGSGPATTVYEAKHEIAQQIRDQITKAGAAIGYLRWVSVKHSLSLKFDGLDFQRFVSVKDDQALVIDSQKMIEVVVNNSPGSTFVWRDEAKTIESQLQNFPQEKITAASYIQAKIAVLQKMAHDVWQICCGHDLVEILSIMLGCIRPVLEKDLRLAFEYDFFRKTQLYQQIMAWEQNNSTYHVFRK